MPTTKKQKGPKKASKKTGKVVRVVDNGNPGVTISILDGPGEGGANHEYYLSRGGDNRKGIPVGEFGHVHFQNGPVQENGVNGIHQEDLLAIVIDRLQSFQAGPFPCEENAMAIRKIEVALDILNRRTADRVQRGVEGVNEA